MCNIKTGQLVKFKNSDNTLNGGTLVDFVVVKDTGEKRALVNTFDAQRVTVAPERLIPVKHQRGDKPTKKFIEKIQKSIDESNEKIKLFGPNENQVLTDAEKIQKLKIQLDEKEKEIKEYQSKIEEQNQSYDALNTEYQNILHINEGACKQAAQIEILKKTISVLSDSIILLKSNAEPDAFERLLDHIKSLTDVNE